MWRVMISLPPLAELHFTLPNQMLNLSVPTWIALPNSIQARFSPLTEVLRGLREFPTYTLPSIPHFQDGGGFQRIYPPLPIPSFKIRSLLWHSPPPADRSKKRREQTVRGDTELTDNLIVTQVFQCPFNTMAKGAIDHEIMRALEIHPETNLPEATPEEHAAPWIAQRLQRACSRSAPLRERAGATFPQCCC